MELEIASFKQEANEISISWDDDKDSAQNTKKQIQKFRIKIDAARKRATEPYRTYIKAVNDKWNEIVESLKEVERTIWAKLLAYDEEVQRKRKEREQKIVAIIKKIYECENDWQIDDIISEIDIDDAQINLAVTYQKQKIIDNERKRKEEEKRLAEEERLKKIKKEAEEKARIAKEKNDEKARLEALQAQEAVAEVAESIEEDRSSREIETWKEEQNEKENIKAAEWEAAVDRIVKKQKEQASQVKGKRKNLLFEVIDPDLVPVQYKTVDEKKIRAALKAKIVDSIPGVKHEWVIAV